MKDLHRNQQNAALNVDLFYNIFYFYQDFTDSEAYMENIPQALITTLNSSFVFDKIAFVILQHAHTNLNIYLNGF